MLEYVVAPEILNEVDRRAEPDRAGDIRCASLEAMRRILELALLEGDAKDHLAAALPRRHRRQQLVPAVEHTDAGWPVGLVTGKRVEIAIQRLHVHGEPRRRLAAVDQHLRPMSTRQAGNG